MLDCLFDAGEVDILNETSSAICSRKRTIMRHAKQRYMMVINLVFIVISPAIVSFNQKVGTYVVGNCLVTLGRVKNMIVVVIEITTEIAEKAGTSGRPHVTPALRPDAYGS